MGKRTMHNVYLREKVWWIDFCYKGHRCREGIGPSKQEAKFALAKRRVQARENKLFDVRKDPKEKFDSVAQKYLERHCVNKRSFERDKTSVRALGKCFGRKMFARITCQMVEKYRDARKQEISNASVNRELACLKNMFNVAMSWGKATSNPVKGVKMLREPRGRLRVLSLQEEQSLLSACSAHLVPIVIMGVETGMRSGEMLSLRWEDVYLAEEGLYLTVRDSKNAEPRNIPISDRLLEVLKGIERKSDYVFCKEDGQRYGRIVKGFRDAVKRAGIAYCRMHDCRHTFATRLVMSGTELVTLKELLGHKTLAMTVRYAHPTPERRVAAIKRLSQLHNSATNLTQPDL